MIHYLQSAAAVVLTFGMVIFLHESGHFFVCRWLGVRVEQFAFGFGPELVGMTGRQGTRYSIRALPLGGYVKPAGEEMEEGVVPAPDMYFGQNWKRRLAIVAAGPIMNYVLAFTLFTIVTYAKGIPEAGTAPVIGNMMLGYPADRAGIGLDDTIVDVNGQKIRTWDQAADAIHRYPEKEISITYEHAGQAKTVKVTPRKDETTGNGVIGIMPKEVYRAVGFGGAASEGARQCWALTAFTVKTIASKLSHHERPDLAGPVGIVQMVSRAAHSGWDNLVSLIGLISVAIGFFNILPVPLLDGGHAAMYVWEGVAGHPPTKETVARAQNVGIAFLLSLLLFATYNDVLRLRSEHSTPKPPAEQPAH